MAFLFCNSPTWLWGWGGGAVDILSRDQETGWFSIFMTSHTRLFCMFFHCSCGMTSIELDIFIACFMIMIISFHNHHLYKGQYKSTLCLKLTMPSYIQLLNRTTACFYPCLFSTLCHGLGKGTNLISLWYLFGYCAYGPYARVLTIVDLCCMDGTLPAITGLHDSDFSQEAIEVDFAPFRIQTLNPDPPMLLATLKILMGQVCQTFRLRVCLMCMCWLAQFLVTA